MKPMPFQIHSTDMQIQHIAQRWKREFEGEFKNIPEFKEVYDKLLMLGDNPTAAEIDTIIGNRSWTVDYCSACHEPANQWIEFVNHSGVSHCLCKGCVDKMHTLFTPKAVDHPTVDEVHLKLVSMLIRRGQGACLIDEINEVFGKPSPAVRIDVKRLPKLPELKNTRYFELTIPCKESADYMLVTGRDGELADKPLWLVERSGTRDLTEFKRVLKDAALVAGAARLPEQLPDIVFHALEDVIGEEVPRDKLKSKRRRLFAECWFDRTNDWERRVSGYFSY